MNQNNAKQPVQNLLSDLNFEVLSHVPAYMRKGIALSHFGAKHPVQNLLNDFDFEVVCNVPSYVRKGIGVSRGLTSICNDMCKSHKLDQAA
ncbi:hypothetical protein V2K54_25525 [Pseudomonas alliivorans]|nr:hypothetical protein [Pseudomonas alliivorans]